MNQRQFDSWLVEVRVAKVQLSGLTKHYDSNIAVDDLTLEVRDGEFMTLLGPSGCGKTTVLRMIAGYIAPTDGSISIDGRAVSQLPPETRDIGMVFQSYALFPHLTVRRNVAFGLERRKVSRSDVAQRVSDALLLVRLEGLGDRFPHELSGGQQQRVALARALVISPTVLLLDEPLSNLDAKLRNDLRIEMRRLQRELNMTTLLVTHDQEEALTVSDRVAVMREGRVQQVASPLELYQHPANPFVANFVGKMNLLPAVCYKRHATTTEYRLSSGELVAVSGSAGPDDGLLAVRPEVVEFGRSTGSKSYNVLEGHVVYRAFLGELLELGIELRDGTRFVARGAGLGDAPEESGARVTVSWLVTGTAVFAQAPTV
jgi:putative spermidine/putrescine transport system ATP-binding protein